MEKSLLKHRLTFDDLLNGLREKGAFNLSEVELAMLETRWTDKCDEKTRISSHSLQTILDLSVEEDHAPSLVIIDGTLLEKHLIYLGPYGRVAS